MDNIINIFSKVNDDQPFVAKVDRFLKQHFITCQSSFNPSDLNITPDFVSWRVTLISKTLRLTNTQHFDYCQNLSLLPNYNRKNVLTITEQSRQKQLITLATHYGLAVREFGEPYNEMVRLPLPSSAHIIADLLIKTAAIYCENFKDWAEKKSLNDFNDENLHEYQSCITTAIRFNSLFDFKDQCELSDILKDF